MAAIGKTATKSHEVTLAGKHYLDLYHIDEPTVSAYIECSWFNEAQTKFMEQGLETLAANPTFSLTNSHHPLSHQYKDINVEEHPEVMNDFEWQECTANMDLEAMKVQPIAVGFFMPSAPDEGLAWEAGWFYGANKPNLIVIPDNEKKVPVNLMMIKTTRIITLSELKKFNFNTDLIYKPYKGKVF